MGLGVGGGDCGRLQGVRGVEGPLWVRRGLGGAMWVRKGEGGCGGPVGWRGVVEVGESPVGQEKVGEFGGAVCVWGEGGWGALWVRGGEGVWGCSVFEGRGS